MKRSKVLFGLFAGVLALVGSTASAQNKFCELGPANLGGQVSCLALDQQDTIHTTVFAGATSGGLFVKSNNREYLRGLYTARQMDTTLSAGTDMWHFIPNPISGREDVLPVSAIKQLPNGSLLIGTGDDLYPMGTNVTRMSNLGKGLYVMDKNTFACDMVAGTRPSMPGDKFAAIHAIDYVYRNGVLNVFVASNTGLYRWQIRDGHETDWNRSPETVISGSVDQLVAAAQLKMVYFSIGGNLYAIADATAQTLQYIDLTSTNSAFGQSNSVLKLAVSPSNPSYLYAMVIHGGMMQNIYLTRNLQTWSELATGTVMPFSYTSGQTCGSVAVDPAQPEHILIGGTTLYSGTGYVEGSHYQWMKISSSEFETNYGNYMAMVFNNSSFVHSGIQQILPVYRRVNPASDEKVLTYYFATNGGVYTTTNMYVYENVNRGLNNMQMNSIAVSPDASVISGSNDNACPFIESRAAHNEAETEVAWYDNGLVEGLNHSGVILWNGSGGQVGASRFQQVKPEQRRNIYVSSNQSPDRGRAYRNYFDYTDNQVWTYNQAFTTSELRGGSTDIGNIYTWETDHNTIFNDSIKVTFDTLGYYMRLKADGTYDSARISGANFSFKAGDKLTVLSRANSDYPFEYTFTKTHPLNKTLKVQNPLQARAVIIAVDSQTPTIWGVYMSWRASDFTKVYDATMANAGLREGLNYWPRVFYCNTNLASERYYRPSKVTMSEDGRFLYVAVRDISTGKTMVVRCKGMETVDFSNPDPSKISGMLQDSRNNDESHISYDTLKLTNGDIWLPRNISSMTTDGNRIILTFDGYNNDPACLSNIGCISNIDDTMAFAEIASPNKGIPAFCSMVAHNGNIYMGTTDGVSIYNGTTWSDYANLSGIPVMQIVQQKDTLPVRHHFGHNGIEELNYVFAKTKWPYAMYFATYGRGIFMDMQFVTDTVNEICDSADYTEVGIPTVRGTETNSVSIYPNPVSGRANLHIEAAEAGNAQLRIYDLNGRCVVDRRLGYVAEGEQTFSVTTEGMNRGMYLVNVIIGGHTAATKMMVR